MRVVLGLATPAEPSRPWTIVESNRHLSVKNGRRTLFETKLLARGVEPRDAFEWEHVEHRPAGELFDVNFAPSYSERR